MKAILHVEKDKWGYARSLSHLVKLKEKQINRNNKNKKFITMIINKK